MWDLRKQPMFKQTFLRQITRLVWITTNMVFIIEEFQLHFRLKRKWSSTRKDSLVMERATLMEVELTRARIRNSLWLISTRSPKVPSNRNEGQWFQERSDKTERGKKSNKDLQFRKSTRLLYRETSILCRLIWFSKWSPRSQNKTSFHHIVTRVADGAFQEKILTTLTHQSVSLSARNNLKSAPS